MKVRTGRSAPTQRPTTPARPQPAAPPPAPAAWSARPARRQEVTAPSAQQPDLARATLALDELAGLQEKAGRRLTLGELAKAFPNARLSGKGQPLSELARQPLEKTGLDGKAVTLAAATVDKNGDLDVTRLFQQELHTFNQHLVIEKGDELPMPLEFGLRNGSFCVAEPAHQQALAAAGFGKRPDGHLAFDLRDVSQVKRALAALGVDPGDRGRITRELYRQGVSVPLSAEDKLRRVVCGLLDSPNNYVDLDDRLVEAAHVGDHNEAIRPTVYGSAKVSPENPGHVILGYKRFNNQSYAAQGGRVANALGKDTKSQHEGDMEMTFVKIDARTHQLESMLAGRHSYGELYDRAEVARLQAETGLDGPALSVSFKAHGGDLVGARERQTFAGHGEDGVREGDWKDTVLTERFSGVRDTAPGGRATLLRREDLNLVLEADDQQALNMKVRLGDQREGLLGTKLLDQFNDGVRMDRFFGTSWFYRQEQLNQSKAQGDTSPSHTPTSRT